MSGLNFSIGSIVIVHPEAWRNRKPYLGKVREILPSGAYVSRMLGKKNASLTAAYYSFSEIESYPHAFGCQKFNDGKCDCGYENIW